MQPRLNAFDLASEPVKLLRGLEAYLHRSSIERPLLELVKLRASQINECAYCLDMHSKDARAAGETEQRIYCLSAWRECPFYTDRERAALEWTEAVTLITDGHVPDEIFQRVRPVFTDQELVDLNFAVVAINAWNRLCVPFRVVPGAYQPAKQGH
jgi:AhpD family alkylhydroperoxidase